MPGKALPKSNPAYDPSAFPPFAVTVDIAIFTIEEDSLKVLLIERGVTPYKGRLALPGGFVKESESLEDAARRELQEETDIAAPPYLEQLGAYGDPGRDPRMRVVTVAFAAIVPDLGTPRGGTDAEGAKLVAVSSALRGKNLAFDHDRILRDALERVRSRFEHSNDAAAFLDREFSLAELRRVYEIVWGSRDELDVPNFRRKVLAAEGFLTACKSAPRAGTGGGRPAQLYRKGPSTRIDPPIRRP